MDLLPTKKEKPLVGMILEVGRPELGFKTKAV